LASACLLLAALPLPPLPVLLAPALLTWLLLAWAACHLSGKREDTLCSMAA
jgi:hypothetical protein